MKKPSSLFEHPITFKQLGDYLVFSCPDLVITWTCDVPKTKEKLLEVHLKFLSFVKARKKDFSESKVKLPSASKINFATPKKEAEQVLTSTQAGKLMGISKRKILYDADAGLLTGTRSSGGNSRKGDWKFTRADLLSYKARLEALKVEKQWLTPTDCAAIWKVSVNTARNWIDKGKVYSTKTKGGHRLVAKSLAEALRR